LLDFGIVNSWKLDKFNKEMFYIYQKCKYNINYKNIIDLLNIVTVKDKRIIIPNFTQKCNTFLELYESYDKTQNKDVNILYCLQSFCKQHNIQITSGMINTFLQLIILETFHINPYSVKIPLKTLHYMKQDDFFMKEMGDYILKFYKLECKYANKNANDLHKYID
jgi:predicted unusual protein kinase regulating ubiquinone biosynthesis (AarF/ABC1/UbiB family)